MSPGMVLLSGLAGSAGLWLSWAAKQEAFATQCLTQTNWGSLCNLAVQYSDLSANLGAILILFGVLFPTFVTYVVIPGFNKHVVNPEPLTQLPLFRAFQIKGRQPSK